MLVRIMNPCVERCRQFGSKLHMTIVAIIDSRVEDNKGCDDNAAGFGCE